MNKDNHSSEAFVYHEQNIAHFGIKLTLPPYPATWKGARNKSHRDLHMVSVFLEAAWKLSFSFW